MPSQRQQNENDFRKEWPSFLLLLEQIVQRQRAKVRLGNKRSHFPIVKCGNGNCVARHEQDQEEQRQGRRQACEDSRRAHESALWSLALWQARGGLTRIVLLRS